MLSKPVAVRLTSEQLAKARDGLIRRGVDSENLLTRSSILRLSVYLAISMNSDPNKLPSEESLAIAE